MLVFSIPYTRTIYGVSPVSGALFVPVFSLCCISIDIMGKSKDKRSSSTPPVELFSTSVSQPSSGFPPRTFVTNTAAPVPLISQDGPGVFPPSDGCTRFPAAVDEEGVNNPPSDRIDLEPVPQAGINFTLFNKFLAFANLNSGALIPPVSAPAALGAPHQIVTSARYLTLGGTDTTRAHRSP